MRALMTCVTASAMVLVLASCNEAQNASEIETAPVETGTTLAASDVATEDTAIRAFIDDLLGSYAESQPPSPFDHASAIFDPELASAIKALADEAERTGEMPDAFGADPVCGCQDFGDFSHRIDTVSVDGRRASVAVTVSNFGSRDNRTIDLVNTPAGWRVYDLDGDFRALVLQP